MSTPIEIALQEMLTKEIPGVQANNRVLEYFKAADNPWVKSDETAWCAAFVAYCLEKAGFFSTNKLNARSYLTWGQATTTPVTGDIVVFWRGAKNGWEGHVGFFISEEGDNIKVLGGNQGNSVSVALYPKAQLLGYRKVETKPTLNKEAIYKMLDDLRKAIEAI